MHNKWGSHFPFPFNLFRQDLNVTYRIQCKKCNWQKVYQVFSGTVWYASGATQSDDIVKTKRELPATCPECGAKVKKIRLPCFVKEY